MSLDRQISLFKVDTNAFLSKDEQKVFDNVARWKRVFSKIKKELKVPEKNKEQKKLFNSIKVALEVSIYV